MTALLNIEIKARAADPDFIRKCMEEWNADYRGLDEQTDIYFKVPAGRLKLRRGEIENNLIFYHRSNQPGPKGSHFQLSPVADSASLENLLTEALGVKIIVRKKRAIWYIGNVKFHLDEVGGLGHFVEIEASNKDVDLPRTTLEEQCQHYMEALKIQPVDLIDRSYSDLLSE